MRNAVKITISLPQDLARDAEARSRAEGKSLSAIIQDALRVTRIERLPQELHDLKGFSSRLILKAAKRDRAKKRLAELRKTSKIRTSY